MQKLKMSFFHLLESLFTCFLKDKTLHNHWDYAGFTVPYYNIPSNNRELQPSSVRLSKWSNYNIPSNNRELQQKPRRRSTVTHYNIPSNNRELQPHSFSVSNTSNYNIPSNNRELQRFSLSSFNQLNYNIPSNNRELQLPTYIVNSGTIITYQVITGNYSRRRVC